jgi:hypothetical protein
MPLVLDRVRAVTSSIRRAIGTSIGNDGALLNVQTHLAAAAEARAAVDQLAWRLAAAERAQAAQRAADVEPLPRHAA